MGPRRAWDTAVGAAALLVALGASALACLAGPAEPVSAHTTDRASTARISGEASRAAVARIVAEDGRGAFGRSLGQGDGLDVDRPAEVLDVEAATPGASTRLTEAYRTVATSQTSAGTGPTRFTSTEPTQRLRFTSDGADSGGAGRRGALVGGGVALVSALATLVTVRLLRRTRSRP